MGTWDDDDFEVELSQVDEKIGHIANVEEKPEVSAVVHKAAEPKKAAKEKANSPAVELSGELTEKEKAALQKRSDLSFAMDLFGTSEGPPPYAEIQTADEFREFGENLGATLVSRANSSNYIEMLLTLLKHSTAPLDANKARQLSTAMKTLADEKSAAEKVQKSKGKGAAAKPTMKVSQKSNAKSNMAVYDDYGGAMDNADDYDDDDFM